MEYVTRIMESPAALRCCPVFHADHAQWTSRIRPVTYGRMGYIPGQGFYARIICLESDPLRRFEKPGDPVCRDSAVEIFLAFPDKPQADEAPDNDSLYLNFEINANGAMYAKYGHGRQGRQFILPDEYQASGVRAELWPDFWSVDVLVPQALITRAGGPASLQAGDVFYCNFYKISEDPAVEHYLSFSPIHSPTPNFHLPRFFARSVLTL